MAEFAFIFLFGIIAVASTYEIGTVNKYSYVTTVLLSEKCEESEVKPVGHRLKANVHLTAIWQNPKNTKQKLVKIQTLNPKLLVPKESSFVESTSKLDKIASSTSYLLWEDGSSKQIWEDAQESYSIRNFKRGIASILQLKKSSSELIKENDVSGNCDVDYTVKGKIVRKRKGNCFHPNFDKTLSQPNGIRSAAVQYQSLADYELRNEKSGIISKCVVSESIRTFSNIWHKPTLCVTTKSEFIFTGDEKDSTNYQNKELENVIDELKKTHEGGLESSGIEAILVKKEVKKKDLKSSVAKLVDGLKTSNMATMKSVLAFYKLLPAFRAASKVDILRVLNEKSFKEIRPQLLDLASASATTSSLEAGFEFFSGEKNYNEQLERFIISLAILPRPNNLILKQLMSFLEQGSHDAKIEATILTTLGTLLKMYSKNHEVVDHQFVENVRSFLEDGLKKCDDDSCRLNFLRSLRNAAQPRSARIFFEYAEQGGKIALEALLGLKNIQSQLLPPDNQKKLLNIFNQVGVKQDRTTRGIAAELLLRQQPASDVLKTLLRRLSDQSDLEFSTFLASKIHFIMSTNEELRKHVLKLMPEKDIHYYYSLSQNGKSNVFTRPLLSIEGTNVTYGIENELLEGGILKRSAFDVSFENSAGGATLLSVGLFAEGLGSLAGGESSDDSTGPTAGMELGFLDSYMRPLIFFSSTSELMGHAWSGTASELTPVFQCIFALSDDEKVVVLTNGMVVHGFLRGVISADSSASVKVSLWSRNAQSLVQDEAGLLVRGAVSIENDFVSTQAALQFKGETGIDFTLHADFYEIPFKLCLQMMHPDITVHFDVFRSTSVLGSKYHLKRNKKRTLKIPGRSFAFYDKNNDMCRVMLDSDD